MRLGLTIFLLLMGLLFVVSGFHAGNSSPKIRLFHRDLPMNRLIAFGLGGFVFLEIFMIPREPLLEEFVILVLIHLMVSGILHILIAQQQGQLEWKHRFEESDALFHEVVQMLPHAVIITKVEDDKILFVNQRASDLFLMAADEMIGSDAHQYYVDWKERSVLKQDLLASRSSSLQRELRFRRHDGMEFIGEFIVRHSAFRGEDVLIFAIGDVTPQRTLEQSAIQSEQLVRKLMNAIPDFVIVTDMAGNITYMNQAVHDLLKSDVGHFLDFHWMHPAEVEEHMHRCFEDAYRFESECIARDGRECVLSVHANTVLDLEKHPYSVIYVMRDITIRKEMELQLVQSKEEIEIINNQLIEANEQLVEKTIRDSLTGLYNLRHMNDIIAREISLRKHQNHPSPLSILMLDIDFFKTVNDDFGHLFGDEVLIEVAKTIQTCLRSKDYAARYGGEEFVAVLPDTNLQQAKIVAERIRQAVAGIKFNQMDRNVTVSIGVAQWKEENDDVRELLKRADTMLYVAKGNGRNRVECETERD